MLHSSMQLLEAHVAPDQVVGTSPWAQCTICTIYQTITEDEFAEIQKEPAESEWLYCMCTTARQAVGEQSDHVVDQLGGPANPASNRPRLSGVEVAPMCNDGSPSCLAAGLGPSTNLMGLAPHGTLQHRVQTLFGTFWH